MPSVSSVVSRQRVGRRQGPLPGQKDISLCSVDTVALETTQDICYAIVIFNFTMSKRSYNDVCEEQASRITKRGRVNDYSMISSVQSPNLPTPPSTPIPSRKRGYVETSDDATASDNRIIKRLRSRPITRPVANIVLDAVIQDVMEGLESHDTAMEIDDQEESFTPPKSLEVDHTNRWEVLKYTQIQLITASSSKDHPAERFQAICNVLSALLTAAKSSGCCWFLTRLEKEDFRQVASFMAALVVCMTEEEKRKVNERSLRRIDADFTNELDLECFLKGVLNCFVSTRAKTVRVNRVRA